MILHSDYDSIQGLPRVLLILIFIVLVIAAWSIATIMIKKGIKHDSFIARGYFIGFGIFGFLFGLGRLVLLYHDYFAADSITEILWRIGTAISIAGLTMLCFVIEKYIFPKTKKLLSVIGSICVVGISVLPYTYALIMLYLAAVVLGLLPLGIYIYIAKSTAGVMQKQAIYVILGIVFLMLGQGLTMILDTIGLLDLAASQIMAVVFVFISLIFITLGFVKGPEEKS
jgi:hypothetical protein